MYTIFFVSFQCSVFFRYYVQDPPDLEPKYQHKYVDGVNADEVPEHHTS